MREIKFRLWNKEYKEMYEPDYYDPIGSILKQRDSDILMQYTGLKDKNGVEIWEGDIVEEIVPVEHTIQKAEVRWHVRRAKWVLSNTFRFGGGGERELSYKTLTVVGNIYEHPHLLKQEDK